MASSSPQVSHKPCHIGGDSYSGIIIPPIVENIYYGNQNKIDKWEPENEMDRVLNFKPLFLVMDYPLLWNLHKLL